MNDGTHNRIKNGGIDAVRKIGQQGITQVIGEIVVAENQCHFPELHLRIAHLETRGGICQPITVVKEMTQNDVAILWFLVCGDNGRVAGHDNDGNQRKGKEVLHEVCLVESGSNLRKGRWYLGLCSIASMMRSMSSCVSPAAS